MTQYSSQKIMEMDGIYGAHNYHPLDVVISKAEGAYVWDCEGKKYMDCLSAYSAVNHGHRNKKIIKALKDQADKLTLTSRAFYNDMWPLFAKKLSEFTGKEMILPMNTGAEAVETAIKTMRRWGYEKKGVQRDNAEIIVMRGNFHGRTTTIISFSVDPVAYNNFGPYTPGFKVVDYDNIEAVEQAITQNTVGILVEPIQGEAGVVVPEKGYLAKLKDLCEEHNMLLTCDEVQTGFYRTGKKFASYHDNTEPDIIIMGKALGGGVYPVSAVAADNSILGVFNPGSHGSTFGGNPLASAVGLAALKSFEEDGFAENVPELGEYFMKKLREIKTDKIKKVRGKGLLIAIVLNRTAGKARKYTAALKEKGLLAKETHEWIIRFAPALIITKEEIDWAIKQIESVFKD